MREMSTEMAALLKSKTMIGDNRPTHRITLENYNSGYEWETVRTIRGASLENWGGGSFVTRADGKILVTYCNSDNNSIYLSVVDKEEDIFFNDNKSAENEWIFKGVTEILGSPSAMAQSRLQKLSNGEILLYVYDGGDSTTNPRKLEVYKSSNGLGTDFVLLSIIHSHQIVGTKVLNDFALGVGQPIQIPTGRILVPYVGYIPDSGYSVATGMIAISDDNGSTWINKQVFSSYWVNNFACRGIGKFGNQLAMVVSSYYSAGSMKFMVSNDDGNSWASLPQHPYTTHVDYSVNDGLFWGNDGYSYWLNGDESLGYVLYRCSDKEPLPMTINAYSRGEGTVWGEKQELIGNDDLKEVLWRTEAGHLAFAGTSYSGGGSIAKINGGMRQELNLQARKIDIHRQKGMAGGLTVDFDNKSGILAPDGTINPQLLWPNKEIIIEQGYGNNLLQTFKGTIDSIGMQANGQQADLSISARDGLKRALDQTITTSMGNHVITALDTTVEALWTDLATMAGLQIGTVEETGVTLSEKVFSWETYGDAFSWMDELAGFETVCDWNGAVHFRRDGRPNTATVAYTFREGEDIIQLGYNIDDKDLYRQVIVHGKDSNDAVIEVIKDVPNADYFNILPQKILKIDASEADTIAKCEIIADKAIYLMTTRARIVQFQSIGIPHLERGDFIEVIESSTTISEIYRITDISTSQDDKTYTMNITCYHHAAPEPEV